MNNPALKAMGGMPMMGRAPMARGAVNPMQLIQQFRQFKKNFQGDAEAEVKKMLQDGRMTQEQLDQLQQIMMQNQSMMAQFFQ